MPSRYDYLELCTKLAVFGGTFDPIHNGHIAAALGVLHEFKPQKILFMPAGKPPHKDADTLSSAEDRYQMVLRSIARFPSFDVSRLEINKHGRSFTIDTIRSLKEIIPANGSLLFIVGADTIRELPTWKEYRELLSTVRFAAVPRPGFELSLEEEASGMRKEFGAKIHVLKSAPMDVSSSDIRSKITSGVPVDHLVPREALDYAYKKGLYFPASCLSPKRFEQAKAIIKERISPKRFVHTLGTIEAAEKLAIHYGADTNKARWAALLHDQAKEFSNDKKLVLCKLWGIPLDEELLASIDIAHGLLGAELAAREFRISDEAILKAIRYHTTGGKGMSLLDKIIMLADFIEPNREDYEPLSEMRQLAYKNLDKALIVGMKYSNKELKESGKPIHKWGKEALKELKRRED